MHVHVMGSTWDSGSHATNMLHVGSSQLQVFSLRRELEGQRTILQSGLQV